MEHVSIEEVAPAPYEGVSHTDRRPLSEALDTDNLAITHYRLDPGERFSDSVHAHFDQEEVFVVLAGSATFETRDGDVVVDEREAIRFAPGEFQSGSNDGDEPLVALALGAPRETDDIRISRIPVMEGGDVSCPECGHDHLRIPDDSSDGLSCPACGARLTITE